MLTHSRKQHNIVEQLTSNKKAKLKKKNKNKNKNRGHDKTLNKIPETQRRRGKKLVYSGESDWILYIKLVLNLLGILNLLQVNNW